jgi:erythromycin esterase-like protein/predicted phosphoribosyltransferase
MTDANQYYRNRADAGRKLAAKLTHLAGLSNLLVLGLPRGGVPVAFEISKALRAPLDVLIVRKLGYPGHEELAIGAIASGGIRVINEEITTMLGVRKDLIDTIAEREARELTRRERAFRGGRPPLDVRGRTVVLVDDGLATGSTMLAGVAALRHQKPERIYVASPVGVVSVCERLREEADTVLCELEVDRLESVSVWYADFQQTSDEEVRKLLARAEDLSNLNSNSKESPQPDAAVTASATAAAKPESADQTGLSSDRVSSLIRASAKPLTGAPDDYDELLDLIGDDARIVLIGEATHGTHEFYKERARITRRLIEERGFTDVAIEGDFPDAYRVNRYVRGIGKDARGEGALAGFQRFPLWMWRNAEVLEFIEWMRGYNSRIDGPALRSGFYGLDLYSLHASMKAVVEYLTRVDAEAARRARARYACFDHYGEDAHRYGQAATFGLSASCEREVVSQLAEIQKKSVDYMRRDGLAAEDDYFCAEQNARLAKNAEAYYRSMFYGHVASWNLRDMHMEETLEALLTHLDRQRGGRPARIVVWEHNSHVGDARATESGESGELTVGQLARERHGDRAVLVGFTTYEGTVAAASDWDAPVERKRVRPALPRSYESLFHNVGLPRFLLPMRGHEEVARALSTPLLERAIGVIYRPETERMSHYFHARLSEQFDAVIHIDQTKAVDPLDRAGAFVTTADAAEPAETFPSGL